MYYISNKEKTTFITNQVLYQHQLMSSRLKNARMTYQRLVNYMYKEQIGQNMEVYVDDVLFKRKEPQHNIANLREAFDVLWVYKIKINLRKCAICMGLSKFHSLIVSKRWIEANLEKIQAIISMKSPTNLNDAQKLIGRIVVLKKFMYKSIDNCLPFSWVR